jgi:3D (Asp-Asp-Asp) domain-containing protein
MQITRNKKSASLAIVIILFYSGIIAVLQKLASLNPKPEGYQSMPRPHGVEMRGFTVTAYCPGSCCNGAWAGLTATGKSIHYYVSRGIKIAAVDPTVIALGSSFMYEGEVYRAVDTGGRIKGRRIDILKPDHPQAEAFGVKKKQAIFLLEPEHDTLYSNIIKLIQEVL